MKTRIMISLCAILVSLLGTINSEAQVVIKVRPAKPKVVVIKPAKAKQAHHWREGHWQWSKPANKYNWVKGHWVKNKPGQMWAPGHWKTAPGGHTWVPGHWKKAGPQPQGKQHKPHPGKPHKHAH